LRPNLQSVERGSVEPWLGRSFPYQSSSLDPQASQSFESDFPFDLFLLFGLVSQDLVMNKQSFALIAALLAIFGSVLSLYFSQRDPGIDVKPYQALGAVAAEETAKLLGGKGSVVIMAADLGEYKNLAPMLDAKINSFRKTLKRAGGVTLIAIERVRIHPPSLGRVGEFMLPDQLTRVIEKHPRVDAIVSLVGLSPLTDQETRMLKQNATKLVVASGYDGTYKQLLQTRVLQLAIIPRSENPPETAAKPRTTRDWFDRDYEIVTPNTAASLP
jgi:hypothetical protein